MKMKKICIVAYNDRLNVFNTKAFSLPQEYSNTIMRSEASFYPITNHNRLQSANGYIQEYTRKLAMKFAEGNRIMLLPFSGKGVLVFQIMAIS